jgi:hypothetical protein
MNWTYKNSTEFEIPEGSFGFVYKITSKIDGRKYIGRKYLTASKTTSKRVTLKSGIKKTQKKKSRVESDWRSYMGSCKPLLEDIDKNGKENYTFEILAFASTKGQVNFLECFFQMRANVLGDDSYYNDAIGSGQFRGVRFDENFKRQLKDY